MTNINYTALATSDAAFVARLIANGEMDRALTHARLLVGSIEMALAHPTPVE